MRHLVAVGLAVMLWSTACTRGPKGLSRSEYAATEKAVAALARADEYRDAEALLFEPRFLDAEKAVDELKAARRNKADTELIDKAQDCLADFESHRKFFDFTQKFLTFGSDGRKAFQESFAKERQKHALIEADIAAMQSFLQ